MKWRIKVILKAILLILPLIVLSKIHFQVPIFHEIFLYQITFFLDLFGIKYNLAGYQISTSHFSSIITFDCTGWKQYYIFFALILLPVGIDLSYRLKGLLFLIPLYIYNTFRAVLTIYLMSFLSYSSFRLLHHLLWDLLFLILIFLFWYWWYIKYDEDKYKARLSKEEKANKTKKSKKKGRKTKSK